MSIPKYILLGWYALSAILAVAHIGKERKPTTPGVAVVMLVILAGLAALVVIA